MQPRRQQRVRVDAHTLVVSDPTLAQEGLQLALVEGVEGLRRTADVLTADKDRGSSMGSWAELTRTSHHLATAARDMPQSAAFSRIGLLDVPSSTPPRPSGRKHHISRHLAGLASRRGEKCGLTRVVGGGRSPVRAPVRWFRALILGTALVGLAGCHGSVRGQLTYDELMGESSESGGPLENEVFLPSEDAGPAHHSFNGLLVLSPEEMNTSPAEFITRTVFDRDAKLFPGASLAFFCSDRLTAMPAPYSVIVDYVIGVGSGKINRSEEVEP